MATIKNVGDNLISKLKKSIGEIEDFQVQLSLGQAEAGDKYEEVKKKFNSFLHKSKLKFNEGKKKVSAFQTEVEELQVQLALGKADTLQNFNEQKKRIFNSMSKFEKKMENKVRSISAEEEEAIRHEMEKFKIKLEVLRVHYELGKLDAKDEFESRKHELADSITRIKSKFAASKKANSKKRQERHDELKASYKHMKKAFVKS